ncbi:MAG: Na(+)-translocating NADH-quinone reductase subunit A [Flavobacteriales bacterium]|nr:Na(+)-translocating NADH-quinone reductase subunit A [Flavobacteriales bacterium]MDG1780026.1 Na(+)-translocating NADH-quinone reductase subunit A [Flavobacteriales bacterium]
MAKAIRIRKGCDIRLEGEAEKTLGSAAKAAVFAIKPTDFHGLVPKLVVREGDQVQAGDTLFFDKYNDVIKYNATVSGVVKAIVRGEKRRILEVQIQADSTNQFKDFGARSAKGAKREELIKHLLEGGLWPVIEQRPFSIVANPEDMPRDIFVSGFDSSPLAPDADFVMEGNEVEFQEGMDALSVLAGGKNVHLSYKKGTSKLTAIQNADLHEVSGPHPAGNVGVQIHSVQPMNKGEVIWTVRAQDVVNIGRFLKTGKFDMQRVVALTGSEVQDRKYFNVTVGTSVASMLANNTSEGNNRVISGNVLTGEKIAADGYLGFYHQQLTVIPEGDEPLFLLTDGWLAPGLKDFSLSRAFPTWIMPKSKKFKLTTNQHGEDRAFVVTGQYEKVFPFDIYPVQLVKSIITNDIDAMEKLGIYEVAPEDFALCEYACTSKINVQSIVRQGLDVIKEEC